MPDKTAVQADVYVEDTPQNIEQLREAGPDVIIFENSTNLAVNGERAKDWIDLERKIRERLERFGQPEHVLSREELMDQAPDV
jgi:5'(3')-deoxyribonucleotidase